MRRAARDCYDQPHRNLRSVISIASSPTKESHFATMPLMLAETCIKAGSRPGDVIFDPFAGAGTTLLAANRLGRRAVGIDLNAAYLTLAARRITRGLRPRSKLDPATVKPLSGQLELFAEPIQ